MNNDCTVKWGKSLFELNIGRFDSKKIAKTVIFIDYFYNNRIITVLDCSYTGEN